MIKVQITLRKVLATILAHQIIPEKHVLPGKLHLFPRYPVIERQHDNSWGAESMTHCSY